MYVRFLFCVVMLYVGTIPEVRGTDVLPDSFDPSGVVKAMDVAWSVRDIVEIRRIKGTAISDRSHDAAFIVEEASVDTDDIRYGLYIVDGPAHRTRKLIEASFIDQVSWHPNSDLWTIRADLGEGIQLYDIAGDGSPHPLVINKKMLMVGAADSVVAPEASAAPRLTGISSYQWAPDGSSLWYATYRIRDWEERSVIAQQGILYDDHEMELHALISDVTKVAGAELHLFHPLEGTNELLMYVPGILRAGVMFQTRGGMAHWLDDSSHIRYSLWQTKVDASTDFTSWTYDIRSKVATRLPGNLAYDLLEAVPARNGQGFLTVKFLPSGRHLVQLRENGAIVEDYGKVAFKSLDVESGTGSWMSPDRKIQVLAVRYDDRQGLVTLPETRAGRALGKVGDNLSQCTFTHNLSYGVCVRENVASAPSLMEVHMEDGRLTQLVEVNGAHYSRKRQLNTASASWVNRFGNRNSGYVTVSASNSAARALPTIVVTHGHDADNRFAASDFQWEFPVQVLADQGYLVLSVNEPDTTDQSRKAALSNSGIPSHLGTAELQFYQAFNAVAGMEAALQSSVDRGATDPDETGIAGYSRGGEMVEWTMTQSSLFHVGIVGDAGGFAAGHYGLSWMPTRQHFRELYGGSPFDAAAAQNYRNLSVSFRAKEMAGPLLQLYAQGSSLGALEVHSLLRDARIPTELIYFPQESHIFWGPRHRAAAMQRSIDWFDYWMRRKRNPGAGSTEQYERWDAMAREWRMSRQ